MYTLQPLQRCRAPQLYSRSTVYILYTTPQADKRTVGLGPLYYQDTAQGARPLPQLRKCKRREKVKHNIALFVNVVK